MNHDLSYYRKIQSTIDSSSSKETQIRLRKAELDHYFEMSLDCDDVTINDVAASLVITKATDPNFKHVVTKPGEYVYLGDIVTWCDTDWIVDTINADTRVNVSGKMRRCNVVLKWIDELGVTHSYSGFCEDATKYGEGTSGNSMIRVGEFQIKIKLHLDENSVKLNRGKRFLIDADWYLPQIEAFGSHPSAYIVTRRNVLTGIHDEHGYVELSLVECAYSNLDNPYLMIADYYSAEDVYAITISNADSKLTVAKSKTFTLSCTATKNGVSLLPAEITYQSSDTSVATISAVGKITGVANGICTISIRAGNARTDIALTVEASSSTASIKIITDNYDIVYGQTKTVSFVAYQNGVEVSATFGRSISPALGIASISSSGTDNVVLLAANDEDNIGETVTLTVTSAALSATASAVFTIRGWF